MIPEYLESLSYKKNFKGKSESRFKEQGVSRYAEGLDALRKFYPEFGITIVEIKTELLEDIVDEDDFQVWCLIQ